MRENIFITGCSGGIGKLLTKLLLAEGYEVRGSRFSRECGIEDSLHSCQKIDLLHADPNSLFEEYRTEILIHTAWLTKPSSYWNSEENMSWTSQSKRLIEKFEASGGKYVVVLGSCAEYSWNGLAPLTESSLEAPKSLYGESKLLLLNWLRSGTLPFLWTRTFFQIGLSDSTDKFIPSLIKSLLANEEFVVQGRNDTRDFVLEVDVANVLNMLINKRAVGVVNVGTGKGVLIGEIVQTIVNLLGQKGLLVYGDGSRKATSVIAETSRLYSIIGNYAWQNLESSLDSMILGIKSDLTRTRASNKLSY